MTTIGGTDRFWRCDIFTDNNTLIFPLSKGGWLSIPSSHLPFPLPPVVPSSFPSFIFPSLVPPFPLSLCIDRSHPVYPSYYPNPPAPLHCTEQGGTTDISSTNSSRVWNRKGSRILVGRPSGRT